MNAITTTNNVRSVIRSVFGTMEIHNEGGIRNFGSFFWLLSPSKMVAHRQTTLGLAEAQVSFKQQQE